MKKCYKPLEVFLLNIENESPILSASTEPVQEIKLEVEVDEYIKLDDMEVTFD